MNDFPKSYDENFPGLRTFLFIPVDDVVSVGDPVDEVIEELTFDSGAAWYEGYAIPGTLAVEEVSDETDHGTLIKCKIGGLLPKDIPDTLVFLKDLKGYRFLVAVQDLNDQWKLYGSLTAPCIFSYTLIKDSENNHYEFAFSAVHTDGGPWFLDESLV